MTGNDGTTLIPFWIESWNASTRTASIWINVPTIPSAGTTLYLYYGNPAATTASNGTATFEFFDDFDSTGTAVLGYHQLGLPQTELVQDQAWEAQLHTILASWRWTAAAIRTGAITGCRITAAASDWPAAMISSPGLSILPIPYSSTEGGLRCSK